MLLAYLLLAVINIQAAQPCWLWSLPYKFSDDCCEEKLFDGDLYSFHDIEEAKKLHGCLDNCVYTKESEPGSKYCFKMGGTKKPACSPVLIDWHEDMKPVNVCVPPGTEIIFTWESDKCYNVNKLTNNSFHQCNIDNGTCENSPQHFEAKKTGKLFFAAGSSSQCMDGMKAQVEVSNNCSCRKVEDSEQQMNLSFDYIKNLTEFFRTFPKQFGHNPSSQKIMEFYSLFNGTSPRLFTPDQEKVLLDAGPCTPMRIDCNQCYTLITMALFGCILNKDCNKSIAVAQPLCNRCIQQITQKCIHDLEVSEGPQTLPTTTANATHPCDRDCKTGPPLICQYNLTIEWMDSDDIGPMNDGPNRKVLAYNKQVPGPPIVICEGDELVVNLTNGIDKTVSKGLDLESVTTLHFHGIRELNRPWADGVPWITQCPIEPGENFTYGFHAEEYFGAPPGTYTQTGTYWYHSHVGNQRTNGAYGALVIRPNKTEPETRFDVDGRIVRPGGFGPWTKLEDSDNRIILQEWYDTPNKTETITGIHINGKGNVKNSIKTDYAEYTITRPGDRYMFRVIGAISEDVPLRLSIEGHKFKVIAVDSQDIETVENLDYLWVAGGERFHIVVQTKEEGDYNKTGTAYKIKVLGYANPNNKDYRSGPYCTIAWLKYPGQTIGKNYVPDCNSSDFIQPLHPARTLNPVPIDFTEWNRRLNFSNWNATSGNIFINDIRALQQRLTLNFLNGTIQTTVLNRQYIEFVGITFNNITFRYPDVPLLLQDDKNGRCGTVCDLNFTEVFTTIEANQWAYLNTTCKPEGGCMSGKQPCQCHHILQQPLAPGYWTELILINNKLNATAAHPIHQHGGWFWVVGMGKFDYNINSTFIEKLDTKCRKFNESNGTVRCLPRNHDLPPAMDTIQVPPGGYVILRTPLDNRGTWFMHCHINRHVNMGMAMVLQIGGLRENTDLHRSQAWCPGKQKKNQKCKTLPYQNTKKPK